MNSVATKLDRSIGAYPDFSDPTSYFGHIVAEVFNGLSGFVREPHFLQCLDRRADIGTVDLLLILDYGAGDFSTGGVIPDVFFNSLPELERDGRKHILSATSEIVTIEVADRETIYFSVLHPCSCKGLYPLGYSSIFSLYPVI